MSGIETNLRIVRLQVALEASDAALTAVRGRLGEAMELLDGHPACCDRIAAAACQFGEDVGPCFRHRLNAALSSPPEAPKDLGQAGLRRDSGTDPVAAILAVECPNVAMHTGGEAGVLCYERDGFDCFDAVCASRIRLAGTGGKP